MQILRPNAMLHIVTVSDEHEQSYGHHAVGHTLEQIQNKKGNPNMVRYLESPALSAGGPAHRVEQATGMPLMLLRHLDICSDWFTIESLEQLAQAVVLDSYILDNPAIESTIEVTVNGYPTQTIGTSMWI